MSNRIRRKFVGLGWVSSAFTKAVTNRHGNGDAAAAPQVFSRRANSLQSRFGFFRRRTTTLRHHLLRHHMHKCAHIATTVETLTLAFLKCHNTVDPCMDRPVATDIGVLTRAIPRALLTNKHLTC
jgi:hypothetical protein